MSNLKANDELKANLRRFYKLWRYAEDRAFSFAAFYRNKVAACLAALGWQTNVLALLSPQTVYACWL